MYDEKKSLGFSIEGNHRRGICHSRRFGRECDELTVSGERA